MATIGLCMIVRNEAHIMERCLAAALPLIDYACIVDTGSTDDTVAVTQGFLDRHAVPYDLHHDIWKDFSTNRNAALSHLQARADIDYCLMLDADDLLVLGDAFDTRLFKEALQQEVYQVTLRLGDIQYRRPVLFENDIGCYYRGKLHEFLVVPATATQGQAEGFHLQAIQDSARNQDPQKYLRDAEVITQAMQEETDPFMLTRYSFYLGQSYMNGGEPRKAIGAFRERIALGGWNEEIFISRLNMVRLMIRLEYREDRIIHAFLEAWSACPHRAEALHGLAVYARHQGKWQLARLFAGAGMAIPKPTDSLFMEGDVYDYKLRDEYAIAAYWCGDYSQSLHHCITLLKNPVLPASERARITANANFALRKIAEIG